MDHKSDVQGRMAGGLSLACSEGTDAAADITASCASSCVLTDSVHQAVPCAPLHVACRPSDPCAPLHVACIPCTSIELDAALSTAGAHARMDAVSEQALCALSSAPSTAGSRAHRHTDSLPNGSIITDGVGSIITDGVVYTLSTARGMLFLVPVESRGTRPACVRMPVAQQHCPPPPPATHMRVRTHTTITTS